MKKWIKKFKYWGLVAVAAIVVGWIGLVPKVFFADELIANSKNENNEELIVKADFNRYEIVKGLYWHNYTIYRIIGKDIKVKTRRFWSLSQNITTGEWLIKFKNEQFSDLSTREKYLIKVNLDGEETEITVNNLEGDFVTKSSLAYLRFFSEGEAVINQNGKTDKGRAALGKTASNNSEKYLFFDRKNKVKSKTNWLVFWDEERNFYLVDDTKVENPVAKYPSHTWVLYKNNNNGTMKKFFEGEVKYQIKEGKDWSWQISLPDWPDKIIELKSGRIAREGYWYKGNMAGEITERGIRKKLTGFFEYFDNK